jgi:hypothetical protein
VTLTAKGTTRPLKVIKWILAAFGLLFGLVGILIIVIVVAAGASLSHSAKHDQAVSKAVTAKMHLVRMGMTQQQVIAVLGTPGSRDLTVMPSITGKGSERNVCFYYGGLLAGHQWQLCFTNNQLNWKNEG